MAFVATTADQVDAKSPVSDDWTDQGVRLNVDHLKSTVTDGASAAQNITGNVLTMESGTINNNFAVTGTLTTGVFFSSEQLLWFSGF